MNTRSMNICFIVFAVIIVTGFVFLFDIYGYLSHGKVSVDTSTNVKSHSNTVTTKTTDVLPEKDGAIAISQYDHLQSLALSVSNNVHTLNDMIHMTDTSQLYHTITTYAGTGSAGSTGDGGAATSAQLNTPYGVFVDSCQNIYIADSANNKIRLVSRGGIVTTIAGTGTAGSLGDGGAAINGQLNYPLAVAVANQNIFIADNSNYKVRKVSSVGILTTYAGTGTAGSLGDGGAATSAQLNTPQGVAIDSSGNVYFADVFNQKVRMVTPGGIIKLFAGTATYAYGSSGDGGAATSALLYNPSGIFVDMNDNVFIASGNAIRMVSNAGIITTIAGTGIVGSSGDGGAATSAQLYYDRQVSVDISGTLRVLYDLFIHLTY